MVVENSAARVILFPESKERTDKKYRKHGLNRNKEGSVRKINGKVYVDFQYLGERVRESSELNWNEKNAKIVREQLDKIVVAIKSGTFKYAEVFPNSKKAGYFTEKERLLSNGYRSPDEVLFKEYVNTWYDLLKGSGRVSERTLLGYKSYIDLYLSPFFDEIAFGNLNTGTFDKFIIWARKLCLRKKEVSNETINKCFVPLKSICKSAAIEYGWGNTYNPFFGFRKLPEGDPLEKIFPFSVNEQNSLIDRLPDRWKPYFRFAFSSGLRQGEQIALKPADIDWSNGLLHVRRAMTRDENGNKVEGRTKNRYSRRTIRLIPFMLGSLEEQKEIHRTFECEYFFCSTSGQQVNPSNLRQRVWLPALEKAGLKPREMKQTRHSFATVALSCGENPLWIAKVMGHRNTEMIIKVYSKYIENAGISNDGAALNDALRGNPGNEEEE